MADETTTFVDESEDDILLPGELAAEDEETEEPQDSPEGEQQQQEPEQEQQPEPEQQGPPPIVLSQEQLNGIIQERLARDRRIREQEYQQQQQQQAAQQQQEQEWGNYYNQLLNAHFQNKYQFYAGTLQIDEETAKARAAQEAEIEARRDYEVAVTRQQIQDNLAQQQQREAMLQRTAIYARDRAAAMRDPIVARYLDRIDQFSGGGTSMSFETARRYVLGEALEVELTRAQTTAQQRTLANVNARKNLGVIQGSQAGASTSKTSQLTAAEKRAAARLGVSLKDYAKYKK